MKKKFKMLKLFVYLCILFKIVSSSSDDNVPCACSWKVTPSSHSRSYLNITDQILNGVMTRIYAPKVRSVTPLPMFIFYHGGAFISHSVDDFDHYTRKIASETGYVVASVNYRLAPYHPYPIPLDDVYTATKYIIENPDQFNIDLSRVIISGTSAGGMLAATVVQKLIRENILTPKLQLLIYPRVQFYNYRYPSDIAYDKVKEEYDEPTGAPKNIWKYVGIKHNITADMVNAVKYNTHTLLIEDQEKRKKYESYLDISLIPEEYKVGKAYYQEYIDSGVPKHLYPKELHHDSIFLTDPRLAALLKPLMEQHASPNLADPELLAKLPKTYFMICEKDPRKDQILIYAQRLRNSGVTVDIAFYETCFHGLLTRLEASSTARLSFKNMIAYLKQKI